MSISTKSGYLVHLPGNETRARRDARSLMSALLSALALACVCALVGWACATAVTQPRSLPVAGTVHDDGSGLLASASSEDTLFALLQPRNEITPAGGQAAYGGRIYGGRVFGGTRYGNYRFDWGLRRSRSAPARTHAQGYVSTPMGARGHITGEIAWRYPPRAAETLPVAAEECPSRPENPTLRIDERARVSNVVVYLEDIITGRPGLVENESLSLQLGGTLRIEDCRFIPQVQLISPLGSKLELLGDSTRSREITLTWNEQKEMRMSLAHGTPRTVTLLEPGFWRVRDARLPTSAWVVVAAHPYYTVSADDGTFRLDNVPPGEYTLVVWHQPVSFENPDGTVEQGEPLVHKTRVRVPAGQNKRLAIELPRAMP